MSKVLASLILCILAVSCKDEVHLPQTAFDEFVFWNSTPGPPIEIYIDDNTKPIGILTDRKKMTLYPNGAYAPCRPDGGFFIVNNLSVGQHRLYCKEQGTNLTYSETIPVPGNKLCVGWYINLK